MSVLNAYSDTGGTASAISYPLEEDHPITDLQEVEDAFQFANEALEAAQRLEDAALDYDANNKTAARLLNVAVEAYIEKFSIPRAALENDVVVYDPDHAKNSSAGSGKASHGAGADEDGGDDEDRKTETSKLKKVALYLFAIVQRIFKAIFDFYATQKSTARKMIPLTKVYIGESDSLSASIASQLSIKDRGLMQALHIEGVVPKQPTDLFDELAETFEKQHQFSAVAEVIRLISATKEKNQDRILKEADILRDKLEAGLQASLESVDPSQLPIFTEKKSGKVQYFASKLLFGQNYIYGIVGNDVSASGSFRFSCGVRRDTEVPLRASYFPVLTPDEIRQVSRTALKVCENVIRFSRDEELMKKALREATFLTTKETDQAVVAALRNIAAVGQNSYIVHLRFVCRTMQALMRWCAQSIKRYEEVSKDG